MLPRSIVMPTPSSGMDASRRKVSMHVFCFGFPRCGTLYMPSLIFLLLPELALSAPALPLAFALYDLFLTQKNHLAVLDFPVFHSSCESKSTLMLLTPYPAARTALLLSRLRLDQKSPTQHFIETDTRGQTRQLLHVHPSKSE